MEEVCGLRIGMIGSNGQVRAGVFGDWSGCDGHQKGCDGQGQVREQIDAHIETAALCKMCKDWRVMSRRLKYLLYSDMEGV